MDCDAPLIHNESNLKQRWVAHIKSHLKHARSWYPAETAHLTSPHQPVWQVLKWHVTVNCVLTSEHLFLHYFNSWRYIWTWTCNSKLPDFPPLQQYDYNDIRFHLKDQGGKSLYFLQAKASNKWATKGENLESRGTEQMKCGTFFSEAFVAHLGSLPFCGVPSFLYLSFSLTIQSLWHGDNGQSCLFPSQSQAQYLIQRF